MKKEKELMIESPPVSELKDDEEEFYSDDLGDDETRSTSPSKLTARQRAKGNKDLQETLVSLPGTLFLCVILHTFTHNHIRTSFVHLHRLLHHMNTDEIEAGTKKALVLTEAERLQRREESARRRKRQMEQKLQDEQVRLSLAGVPLLLFSWRWSPGIGLGWKETRWRYDLGHMGTDGP